jgi:hypothetical protein
MGNRLFTKPVMEMEFLLALKIFSEAANFGFWG